MPRPALTDAPSHAHSHARAGRGPTGHATVTHDGLGDLGHDWSLVADPAALPQQPFKVYLPRSTADVVRAVRETGGLGQRLVVRGAGHSSNGLVTDAGGALLLTTGLDQVRDLDDAAGTVTVQPGVPVVAVDHALAGRGRGLPVVPDHADITVGGFAAVGGLSATSLHDGMFVDNVIAIEYVAADGRVHRASRTYDEPALLRLLGGLGRHGVITELTLRTVPAARARTLLRNDRRRFADPQSLASAAADLFRSPGQAVAARASWLDLPLAGGVTKGVLSAYEPSTGATGALRARGAYGALRGLGALSTRLPGGLGVAAKYAASAGLMVAPRYATERDVQRFSDGILDFTVGEPTRLLVALTPVDVLPQVFGGMLAAATELRERESCLTVVSVHLKGIRSPYLTGAGADVRSESVWAEVLMVVGIDEHWMTPALTDRLVEGVDQVCREHGALRYMHTATHGGDDLDPNARHLTRQHSLARSA